MSLLEAKVDSAVASQQTPALTNAADRSPTTLSGSQQPDQVVEQPLSTAPSVSDALEEIDVGTPHLQRADSKSEYPLFPVLDVVLHSPLSKLLAFPLFIGEMLSKMCGTLQGGALEQITKTCRKALLPDRIIHDVASCGSHGTERRARAKKCRTLYCRICLERCSRHSGLHTEGPLL